MRHLSSFYEEHPPDVERILSLSHRQIRLHLQDGRFRKLKKQVRSAEELQSILARLAPLDVYYSVGRWLNPCSVGARPPRSDDPQILPGHYSKNLFLGADLAFDIDVPPLSRKNLASAQAITRNLVAFLSERYHLSPRYLAFSGGKGFHVVYDDIFHPRDAADPLERERRVKERRQELVREILDEGIAIDGAVTKDTRRILRLPGTVNSRTGYCCRILDERELEGDVRNILKSTERCRYSPGILARGDDAILRIAGKIFRRLERSGVSSPPLLSRGKGGKGLGTGLRSLPPVMYASYVTNPVHGVAGRYVPFFRWPHSERSLERIQREMPRVQSHYRLGPVYLLDGEDEILGFSLRSLQRRRCEKVVAAARSRDAVQFRRWKRQFLRVGPVEGPDGRAVFPAPRLLEVLPGSEGDSGLFASRPHFEFFSQQGVPLEGYSRLHGAGAVKMTHCVLEN